MLSTERGSQVRRNGGLPVTHTGRDDADDRAPPAWHSHGERRRGDIDRLGGERTRALDDRQLRLQTFVTEVRDLAEQR